MTIGMRPVRFASQGAAAATARVIVVLCGVSTRRMCVSIRPRENDGVRKRVMVSGVMKTVSF